MVNKVAVLLVGGIVVVAVAAIGGVAAFVFGVGDLGGSGGSATATPTAVAATPLPSPGPDEATPTPAQSGGGPDGTPAGTPVGPGTATPYPSVSPSEFNESLIEDLVVRGINRRRMAIYEDRGQSRLRTNGTLWMQVQEMAHNHSEAMAQVGEATHVINGTTSADRYRQNDLYTTCQWQRPAGQGFAKPDNNGFEVSENGFEAVTRTYAGRPYETASGTDFNGNESAVADDIVESWWEESTYPPYRDRLNLTNARHIGVGIEVTQYGEVYATANLC